MKISTTAVGFTFDEDQTNLINKKLERIKYADDLIIDLLLRIKEDKQYFFDCTVNFRWGTVGHVSTDDYEFAAGINKLMDILDTKIKKEKDKIQEKK